VAGRNPAEAVRNFLDPLQQALSCITREPLYYHKGNDPSSDPYSLALRNSPVKLGRDKLFTFRIGQQFEVIKGEGRLGPFKVQTLAYAYTLYALDKRDDREREIFSYHWHPRGQSPIIYPHLHLAQGAEVGRDDVRGAHFPTGRISLEEVLRLVIEEFHVKPLRHDWADILQRTKAAFEEFRTWPK
jgi:hypothetical protein